MIHTASVLNELLLYDKDTGFLTWKARSVKWFTDQHQCDAWNTRLAGKRAGTSIANTGYYQMQLFKKGCLNHRIIWTMVSGSPPTHEIDHINHVRTDNRLINLREVQREDNCRNITLRGDNKSGYNEVIWYAARNKWMVYVTIRGKRKHLGYYSDLAEAAKVAKDTRINEFFHENHGKVSVPA
jgi:hypothetical protein